MGKTDGRRKDVLDGDENEHLCNERWLHVWIPPSAGGGGRRTVPWVFLSLAVARSLLRRACLEALLSLFFFLAG